MKRIQALFLIALVALSARLMAADGDFPYRARYPDAPIMDTETLHKQLDTLAIVDVRSRYEFDTLRIKGAVSVPLSDKNFVERVKALAQQGKAVVCYCNGHTCHKSYDAVLLLQRARVANVFVYDNGVFGWAKAHPELTVLIDKTPIKADELIEEERFKARLLAPKDFANRVGNGVMVLDIRDRVQRDNMLFPFKEQRAQLDEKARIEALLEQVKREGKTLLVYDATGKQVQWFQYHLESKGIKDYYFMKNGAQGYYDATLGKVELGKAP